MSLTNNVLDTEKRKQARHKCEAAIEWSYFNKELYFDAKLLNFSADGVYFETGHDLKPGATIFLKMDMVSSNEIDSLTDERPRSVSLGEVKWQTDLSRSDQSIFGIGVRYPFPA